MGFFMGYSSPAPRLIPENQFTGWPALTIPGDCLQVEAMNQEKSKAEENQKAWANGGCNRYTIGDREYIQGPCGTVLPIPKSEIIKLTSIAGINYILEAHRSYDVISRKGRNYVVSRFLDLSDNSAIVMLSEIFLPNLGERREIPNPALYY
jgi:hypothetical protein